MPLFDKFVPQRYNFFEYYADFPDIFLFHFPLFILLPASFYFHHFLHLPIQLKIVGPDAICLLKAYPSATVCRTRGVRFILVGGYGVQHVVVHFLSLSNVQPTPIGEHAPHPFQRAVLEPLHPHMGANYLCHKDADSR